MKKFISLISFFAVCFLTSVTASAITINCTSVEGKTAKVKIISDTIHIEDYYANVAEVEVSEMEDEDLNVKGTEAHYIRDEGNNEIPSVVVRLSNEDHDSNVLSIIFEDHDLTTAELTFYDLATEVQVSLAKLSCEKE